MRARQSVLKSPLFGDDIKKLNPIITPGGSDSSSFDNAVELLFQAGRELPHVMAMMIPGSLGRQSAYEAGEAGLLRVSRLADGAVGWTGGDGVYRRFA